MTDCGDAVIIEYTTTVWGEKYSATRACARVAVRF